jgi:hypothetical protein
LGEIVYANVTIVNEGTEPEAFDVYVYADAITIETMLNITLCPEANTTLSLSWDTTGVDDGGYTLSAEVPPVQGEMDVEDNFFVDGAVTVSLLLKHDVAVIKVNAPREVTRGTRVEIRVDVANLGDFDETLNVSVTYDATLIETFMLTPLDSGSSVILGTFWDTRGVEPNTYTISAEAFLGEDENLVNNKASTMITIILGPAPPTASFFISPAKPIVNEIVTFDAPHIHGAWKLHRGTDCNGRRWGFLVGKGHEDGDGAIWLALGLVRGDRVGRSGINSNFTICVVQKEKIENSCSLEY